jgi:hypothetical protein
LIEKNRKIFEQERRKFRRITQSRSKEHQQQKVVALIREKVNKLLTIDDSTFTKFTDFINIFRNEGSYHFYHSINRENWKPNTPLQSFSEISTWVPGTRVSPLKEITKQKEDDGKNGKRATGQLVKPFLPENWDRQMTELEDYFISISRTPASVKLNNHTTITNVPHFIQSHLAVVRANNGNKTFEPYLARLYALKETQIKWSKSVYPFVFALY